MFLKSKNTEIYCMSDDFCKKFALQEEKYMIEDKKTILGRSTTNLLLLSEFQ